MERKKELHIVFGVGALGLAVMRALTHRGHEVLAVSRGRPAYLPPGVRHAALDAKLADKVRALCTGATVVYQCAAPAYTQWTEKFPPLQANILDGAAAAGAKLVIGDNLYMYGEHATMPLRESLREAPTTRKGVVRAQLATSALDAHRAGKVRVAIGRGADFFGPCVKESALGARALLPALRGKAVPIIGNADLSHSYTFIDDFASALVTLGEHDKALGKVWHVPNAPVRTTREWVEIVASLVGKPLKISSIGRRMMKTVGFFVPAARESVEMMYLFEKPMVVDSSAYELEFGQRATDPYVAMANTLSWYRENLQKNRKITIATDKKYVTENSQ